MTQQTITGPGKAVGADIPRDRWGRPLIKPLDGGEPVPYIRVSKLAGLLDDTYNLNLWKMRQAVTGLLTRDDLRISASAHLHDKTILDKLLEQAQEAASASAKSTLGTAMHTYTEKIDRGLDLGVVPFDIRADLDAYRAATAKMRMVKVESFIVCDDVRAAGTFDRLIEFEGRLYIGDLKTGRVDYPHKFAIQKAVYAHGQEYEPATGDRRPVGDVDLDEALLIHLPAGEGRCEVHWIDIEAGWEAAQHAAWVHQWRSRKGLSVPVAADRLTASTEAVAAPAAMVTSDVHAAPSEDVLAEWISQALTVEHLTQLWQLHGATFSPALNELAAAQHHLITGGLIATPKTPVAAR